MTTQTTTTNTTEQQIFERELEMFYGVDREGEICGRKYQSITPREQIVIFAGFSIASLGGMMSISEPLRIFGEGIALGGAVAVVGTTVKCAGRVLRACLCPPKESVPEASSRV